MSDLRELNNECCRTAEMIVSRWGNESRTPYGVVSNFGRFGEIYSVKWKVSPSHREDYISFVRDSLPSNGASLANLDLTMKAVERLQLIVQHFSSQDVTNEVEVALEILKKLQKIYERVEA
jgi:hypothetical protein